MVKMQEWRIAPRVVRGKISQAEFTRQQGIVDKHVLPFFGAMKLAGIRKADLTRYIHERTGQCPMAPSSKKRIR